MKKRLALLVVAPCTEGIRYNAGAACVGLPSGLVPSVEWPGASW